jgi:hypothetical protein
MTGIRIAVAAGALAAVAAATTPADAGGVLLCNWLGCRSSPYFPPPVVVAYPPVVFMPPPGAEQAFRPPPPPPVYGPMPPPPARSRAPVRFQDPAAIPPKAPPAKRTSERPSPGADRAETEGREIEGDIRAFCDGNPSEPFCVRLTDYLRRYAPNREGIR